MVSRPADTLVEAPLIMIHPLSSVPFHSMVFMRSTDMPAPVSSVIARIAGELVKNRRWRWVSDGFSQYETTLCVTYAVPSQDYQIPRPPDPKTTRKRREL